MTPQSAEVSRGLRRERRRAPAGATPRACGRRDPRASSSPFRWSPPAWPGLGSEPRPRRRSEAVLTRAVQSPPRRTTAAPTRKRLRPLEPGGTGMNTTHTRSRARDSGASGLLRQEQRGEHPSGRLQDHRALLGRPHSAPELHPDGAGPAGGGVDITTAKPANNPANNGTDDGTDTLDGGPELWTCAPTTSRRTPCAGSSTEAGPRPRPAGPARPTGTCNVG